MKWPWTKEKQTALNNPEVMAYARQALHQAERAEIAITGWQQALKEWRIALAMAFGLWLFCVYLAWQLHRRQ
jgi:hypothetical protein